MTEVLHRKPFITIRDSLAGAAAVAAPLKGAVVAIGNFEGVHRGHRAVIGAATARARALGCPAAAMTFEPHPRSFFNPHDPVFRLTDERAKLRLLAATGLDGAIVLTFDAALAGIEPDDFIAHILLERFAVKGVAVGYDFHFGKKRAGTPDMLADEGRWRGFSVDIVPPLRDGERRISSGAIRAALTQGHVEDAAALLGYPWFVTGKVVHGEKRGRELGYPTANIRLDPACALRHGVYAVRVGVGGRLYDGVANFGRRPMFDTGIVLLEVFLFDFSGDLYDRIVDVAFVGWIRHELTFPSIEDLVRRMDEDSRIARLELARAPDAFPPLAETGG
jgi:riboflavin kinase/FMN adenylyltransferase